MGAKWAGLGSCGDIVGVFKRGRGRRGKGLSEE